MCGSIFNLSKIEYERLAKNLDKLYSEHPELLFKLYNQLRKYFVTNEDFKQFMEQSNMRFQEILQQMEKNRIETNQRFEKIDQRFEEVNQRFEEVNQRFEEVNQRFESLTKYMDRRFSELSIGYGATFEGFNKTILKKILEERGIPVKAFTVTPIHFNDSNHIVHVSTTDVEINIFSEDPPIIGEVTSSLVEIEKLETFIRKIKFIEKQFNKKFKPFFITLYIAEDIQKAVKLLLTQYDIEAITLA